jgi:hypothetical protein
LSKGEDRKYKRKLEKVENSVISEKQKGMVAPLTKSLVS